MKNNHTLIVIVFLILGIQLQAQENVFLARDYWKANPSITQVEKDIKAGNDPTQLNSNAFDAVVYALLEQVDNTTIKHLLSKKGNGVNKRTHDGRTYIFWAAYKDNLDMMKYLVSKGAKTDLIDSHGYTVLNFAAATGQQNTKLYDLCISYGANPVTEKNHDGANALLLVAPFLKDDALINYFIDKGVDLHTTDDQGNGVFNYAAKKGSIPVLDVLIKKGVPYKTLNKKGGNAFIFASQGTRNSSNTLETYKYLETLGIQPDITTDEGFTPLHALAYKNTDLDIFSYFIKKGVDVNQQDSKGNTPFSNAAYRNDITSVKFLAKHVKDINVANKNGATSLMRALQRNDIEIAQFLIDNGANVFAKDVHGNSIAYYVLQSYSSRNPEPFQQKLKLIQNQGIDLITPQAEGHTLWHLAIKENDLDLLKTIATLNIPINHINSEGNTVLHLAAMKAKDATILKFLLDQGADKTIKTEFDETALELASENELLQKQHTPLNFLK